MSLIPPGACIEITAVYFEQTNDTTENNLKILKCGGAYRSLLRILHKPEKEAERRLYQQEQMGYIIRYHDSQDKYRAELRFTSPFSIYVDDLFVLVAKAGGIFRTLAARYQIRILITFPERDEWVPLSFDQFCGQNCSDPLPQPLMGMFYEFNPPVWNLDFHQHSVGKYSTDSIKPQVLDNEGPVHGCSPPPLTDYEFSTRTTRILKQSSLQLAPEQKSNFYTSKTPMSIRRSERLANQEKDRKRLQGLKTKN
ncbi:hypothetical protein F5884DRAFT_143774 [Xylogone sp. PMI_703]|nr:hypothetical protein F5884DRAFT_143774 [Xylogone sp. PMI_703]